MQEQLRRRAVGAPAARSLLLTVLGEYVLPTGRGVWLQTLVSALSGLGYSEPAARQAVARSARSGWLVAERLGRRTRMRLSEPTRELLHAGAERIYSFGAPREWDGRWLVVLVRVAEENRAVRHQLRSSLAWAGLGSLGGGVWLTPHVEREREVAPILAREPLAGALSFIARFGALGAPEQIVATAWDLDRVRDEYRLFHQRFSRVRPATAAACFREQTLLVHAWRRFPFLDPDLPESLLAPGWPRRRSHALFADRHQRWEPAAQAFFAQIEAAAAPESERDGQAASWVAPRRAAGR